jgi:hypothetical protein
MVKTATIADVEVVTIPATEFAELLECRRHAAEKDFQEQRFMNPLRSRIDRDPEVAVFVAKRLGTGTMEEIIAAVQSQFGPGRTPSRSALHRYWARLRKARRAART